jgi:Mg2+/Co2+ transporter CorB
LDDAWQHLIFAIVALLVMSLAALVQSTIGLVSVQRLRHVTRDDTPRNRSVQSLVDPRRVLAASMILLQVLMAIVATGQLIEYYGQSLMWLAMLTVAVVFILFGLALPRALASNP